MFSNPNHNNNDINNINKNKRNNSIINNDGVWTNIVDFDIEKR